MILISAGHNPDDQGACFDGFCEYYEADMWVETLLELLRDVGIDCAKVPTGHLKDKVRFINDNDATLALEIHFNADGWNKGRGSETLRYPKSSRGALIGGALQLAMSGVMGRDRGVIDGYYQLNPEKGIDYFLKSTKCTALILEPEFVHNKEKIQNSRQECCQAIADTLYALG